MILALVYSSFQLFVNVFWFSVVVIDIAQAFVKNTQTLVMQCVCFIVFSFIESLLRRLTYHTEGVRRFLKSLNCTRCNKLYKTFLYLEVCLYFVELESTSRLTLDPGSAASPAANFTLKGSLSNDIEIDTKKGCTQSSSVNRILT